MKIYFIRHGQKETLEGDPPLTDIGKKQAELTGEFLKSIPISALYASPLLRTQQTAEIVGKDIDLPVKTDSLLAERFNWGDTPNTTFEGFLKLWEQSSIDRDFKPPHGLSSRESGKNMEQFLNKIYESHKDDTILIVTHGGILRDFLKNVNEEKNLKNAHILFERKNKSVPECSITIVTRDNDAYTLEDFGDTNHLPTPVD